MENKQLQKQISAKFSTEKFESEQKIQEAEGKLAVSEAKVTQLESRITTLETRLADQKGSAQEIAAMQQHAREVDEYERQAKAAGTGRVGEEGLSPLRAVSPTNRVKSLYNSPERRATDAHGIA